MMQHVVSTTEAVLDGPPDLDMDYFGSYTPIKRKANTKARELFMECLTESELEEFKNFSTVTIRTKIGLFRVEIQDDEFGHGDPPAYNVIHNDNRCCAILGSGGIPRYDHYLMQVLLIKSNPSRFVEEANARRIR